jgi:myo-inositol-1(or 4)-monophosphatase
MDIVEKVFPIIRATRPMLLPYWGNPGEVEHKSPSGVDVVTKLDRDVEMFLSRELKTVDSGIEFAGEEFGGSRDAQRFWLCDPIDGTAHFVRGTPFCTVMLALIEDGQVNFSAIYDFINDDLYHATRGKGSFKNGQPIHVSSRPAHDMYLGWEINLEKEENSKKFLQLAKRALVFKTVASGYEYTLLASGKLEGRVNFDPHGKDWDYAPGSLLVSEAGGIVANIGKRTYDYQNLDFIAASPVAFAALTEGPDAIFPISE